jgi:hypothetical protein
MQEHGTFSPAPADCADYPDENQQSVLIVAIVPILDGALIFESSLS